MASLACGHMYPFGALRAPRTPCQRDPAIAPIANAPPASADDDGSAAAQREAGAGERERQRRRRSGGGAHRRRSCPGTARVACPARWTWAQSPPAACPGTSSGKERRASVEQRRSRQGWSRKRVLPPAPHRQVLLAHTSQLAFMTRELALWHRVLCSGRKKSSVSSSAGLRLRPAMRPSRESRVASTTCEVQPETASYSSREVS